MEPIRKIRVIRGKNLGLNEGGSQTAPYPANSKSATSA